MGYIDEFCRTKETKNINKQLKDMYNKWYETWKCYEENIKKDYFHPQLLTCTDAYLERRIMMFGKEAHTTTTGFEWQKGYLEDDSCYGYDKIIFEGEANNTFFLKTLHP